MCENIAENVIEVRRNRRRRFIRTQVNFERHSARPLKRRKLERYAISFQVQREADAGLLLLWRKRGDLYREWSEGRQKFKWQGLMACEDESRDWRGQLFEFGNNLREALETTKHAVVIRKHFPQRFNSIDQKATPSHDCLWRVKCFESSHGWQSKC